jgi:SAM-dependent methyltransferase
MTSSVREHYEQLLADYYTRMFGDFESRVAEQQALLERLGREGGARARVDLGCGSGFQSLALTRLGYRVLAIDFSERLLRELKERAHGLAIETIRGDICDVAILTPDGLDVAVCMGDTLSHLERDSDLDRLFHGIRGRLRSGGRFVLTFRDLSRELRDQERVVPVRATDDLIMACFSSTSRDREGARPRLGP